MERELLLLGLLRIEEMHGYQLNELIDNYFATCVDIKRSTAYYSLNKMLDQGWITADEEQKGNRPPRRIFTITPEGEVEFQRMLRENLSTYQPTQFENDIGLALMDALPKNEALELLKMRRETLQTQLDEVEETPLHPGNFQLMIEHQRRHLQAEQEWLDEIIARLQSDNTAPGDKS